ncbi:MAG: T9SS type A sorting domain-containing protein, partial [Bacteroidales bacterium]|nr:T9SS type A sorting domain-containing protein [Bacteroidales bacterium]
KVLLDKLHGTAEGNQNQEAIEPDILESLIQDDFKLYPNPVSDLLNIDFTAEEHGNATITIYNTIGQVFYTKTEPVVKNVNNNININTKGLKQGVYVLQIMINNAQIMNCRFVINR